MNDKLRAIIEEMTKEALTQEVGAKYQADLIQINLLTRIDNRLSEIQDKQIEGNTWLKRMATLMGQIVSPQQ